MSVPHPWRTTLAAATSTIFLRGEKKPGEGETRIGHGRNVLSGQRPSARGGWWGGANQAGGPDQSKSLLLTCCPPHTLIFPRGRFSSKV